MWTGSSRIAINIPTIMVLSLSSWLESVLVMVPDIALSRVFSEKEKIFKKKDVGGG
jgi:hypothetical protein